MEVVNVLLMIASAIITHYLPVVWLTCYSGNEFLCFDAFYFGKRQIEVGLHSPTMVSASCWARYLGGIGI